MTPIGLRSGFLFLTALLMLAALVRWSRTPADHVDHSARRDMARLLAVAALGQFGDLLRMQLHSGSPGFLVCSALLVPVAAAALWLCIRLLVAYRSS